MTDRDEQLEARLRNCPLPGLTDEAQRRLLAALDANRADEADTSIPSPGLSQKETMMSEPNTSEPRKSQSTGGEKPNRSAVMAACCLMLLAIGAVVIFNQDTGRNDELRRGEKQAAKPDSKPADSSKVLAKADAERMHFLKEESESVHGPLFGTKTQKQMDAQQQRQQAQSSPGQGKAQPFPTKSGGKSGPGKNRTSKAINAGVQNLSVRRVRQLEEAQLRKYQRSITIAGGGQPVAGYIKEMPGTPARGTPLFKDMSRNHFFSGGIPGGGARGLRRTQAESLVAGKQFDIGGRAPRVDFIGAYRASPYSPSYFKPGKLNDDLKRLSQLSTLADKKHSSSPAKGSRILNAGSGLPTNMPGKPAEKDGKASNAKPGDGENERNAKGDPAKNQPTVELYEPTEVKAVRQHFVKQFKQLAKAHPSREIAIMRVKERVDARLKGIEQQVALLKRAGRAVPAVEGRVIVNEVVRAEVKGLDVDGDGRADFGGEEYESIVENKFLTPLANPLSTLSIDVDTASFSNTRRFIEGGLLPPKDAVRIEELVNYFRYDYTPPKSSSKDPFSVTLEMNACPWNPKHKLVMIGLKGRELPHDKRPAANLVFLVDVSGSMSSTKKLPLVKLALEMLVNEMQPKDRISIVTYSNSAKVALEPTPGDKKAEILRVIHSLNAAGGTNGDAGIQMAYAQAQKNFFKAKDGTNRVILCTDGDFNIGIKDPNKLIEFVRGKANKGVFLSVFGFGMGNYKGDRLEKLSNKGNGNYAYIDGFNEAKKVFVEEMAGTLFTIAKDVKIQVEFNPAKVASYRLIGYENRLLAAQDFNDDKKDAGEIGAGHTVTALYEIVPAAAKSKPAVDELKYQKRATADKSKPVTQEVLTVKLRYKQPDGDKSTKIEFPLKYAGKKAAPSEDFDFASSVAMYGLLLRDSKYAGESSLELVRELAVGAMSKDPEGHRSDFVKLVHKTRSLVARKLGKPVPAPRAFEAGGIKGK